MTILKGITPTPAQAAAAYKKHFGEAIDTAAGKDGRISRSEAARVAERLDAGALVSDNIANFLAATGQKSVSARKFKNVVADYVDATAQAAAGSNQRLSLLEIRNLPDDLQADLKHMRGKDNLVMRPSVRFNENDLYEFMVLQDNWSPSKVVDAGQVSKDATGVTFSGMTDVGEWQGVAEQALSEIWDNVLIYRSWPEGSPVDLGDNGSGSLKMGECIDEETGEQGLLVHWADIDDASFVWFYAKKSDGAFERKKQVFLN